MLLFHRLLLAHLIADFPLQTTELVRWKQRSPYGVIVHCAVVGVVSGLLLYPDLGRFWPGILTLALVHILADQGKISLTRQRPRADNVFSFVGDQLLHVAAIALVALAYRGYQPTSLGGSLGILTEQAQLLDLPHIVFLSCVIGSAFGGTYLVLFLARTYSPHTTNLQVNYAQELLGVVERGAVTAFAAIGSPVAWVAIAVVVALKLAAGFKLHPDPEGRRNFVTFDVLFSALFAVALGLLAQRYGS